MSGAPREATGPVEALKHVFNADIGKVRAIFLASPACDECVHGVIMLERSWLERDRLSNVAVYLVWSSQLEATEQDVSMAKTLVHDDRIRHFWDREQRVGQAYRAPLALRAPAWDVWMLFDAGSRWRQSPPEPVWWEHQLCDGPPDRLLDAARFAVCAAGLAGTVTTPGPEGG